ncbi:MAG: SDR family NAD(P)-dependent oxidoreductase [Cyanobacteria bacterium J06632_3]
MPLLPSVDRLNALVVGASQGIGLEFVRQLLQDSRTHYLFATYRTRDTANQLFQLAGEYPNRLHCLQMDLTEETQISQGLAELATTSPYLHIVINCVGLLHNQQQQPEKALRQLQSDNLLSYFQVNSIGPALLAKHLLPFLKHPDPSLFATLSAKIGSIGDNRIGGWYGYRASKAALNMFLKTAAIEYSRRSPKTTIVMLHPGTTDTRLSKPFQRGVPPEKLFSTQRTVSQLIDVMSNVTPSNSGDFFSWDGTQLPW